MRHVRTALALALLVGCTEDVGPPAMEELGQLAITFTFPSEAQSAASANAHAWVLRPRDGDATCAALIEGDADPFDAAFVVLADVATTGDELGAVSAMVPAGPALVYAEAVDFRGATHLAGCASVEMVLPESAVAISFMPVGVVDCAAPGVEDGASCDDGDECTVGDTCMGGECDGGRPRDCRSAADACNAGTCVTGTGCVPMPLPDGTTCDDEMSCSTNEECDAGRCTGGDRTACCPGPDCIEFDCDNLVDDDMDERFDCADSDCFLNPVCLPPEDCDNFVDDDRDGDADCDDSDCASLPACAGCTSTCPDANLFSELGDDVASGSTSTSCHRRTPACAASSTAPEITYAWTAPNAGTFRIDTAGSFYQTALDVRDGCLGASLACDTGGGSNSSVEVVLTSGQEILIVIDGFGTSSGSYRLNIREVFTSEVGLCDDGLDNDDDFVEDCQDPDCTDDPVCDEICDDFLDNDFDGDEDCEDADCASDPACQEQCSGGVDEDLDGRVDCEDADCIGDPDCGELGMCGGDGDDDLDGDADCDDSECDCACFGPTCPAENLGTSTGTVAFSRSTATFTRCNRSVGSCIDGRSAAHDYTFRWTVPTAGDGDYVFATTSAMFDAAVYVIEGAVCDPPTPVELGCDDAPVGNDASVTVTGLVAGQQMLVIVDGVGEAQGTFNLSITLVP